MGVNKDVMITWDLEGFYPGQYYDFPYPGVVTLPCFHSNGVFWLEVEERDDFVADKMQIAMACRNL